MVFIPTDDGQWVNEGFERLARLIQDYDHNLQLMWIPPDKRTRDDRKPYVIFDNQTQHIVTYASELDSPEDILTGLFMADNKHGDVLTRLEAMNNAKTLMEQKARMDQYEEEMDKAEFLHRSKINYLKMGKDESTGKLIKMDDERNRI